MNPMGNGFMKKHLLFNFLLLWHVVTSSPLEKRSVGSNRDCGREKPYEIFGGIVTGAHQYPWMVLLEGCGGSLISDRHVLTAKHCVEGKDQKWVKVGVHNRNDENDYQKIKIKEYVRPDYLDHDIAIVILEEPVTFSDTIRTICLPTPDEQVYVGNKMRHLGWGMTGVGSEQSALLKQADLTVSDAPDHKNVFYTKVDTIQGDPCAGDSGGPLMYKDNGSWTIYGILRGGGFSCHTGETKGNGTEWNKVTSRLDWINEIIGNKIPSPVNGGSECSEESGVIGPCEGYFRRFTYNKKSGKCEKFIYGGCEGNSNRFKTLEECQLKCNKPGEPSACYTTKSKKCIFPFVYKGQTFNSCTNFGKSPNPWCATRVRSNTNNEVVSGEWGDCDPQSCPSVGAQQGGPPGYVNSISSDCVCGLAQRRPQPHSLSPGPTTRIVGGNETEINEYPWLVALSLGGVRPMCGGSLINDRWILTAAHCIFGSQEEPRTAAEFQITLGEHNVFNKTDTTTIRRSVSQIVNHPAYTNKPKFDYDYSLLKLATPVDFSRYPHIRPICLPENSNTGQEPDHVGGTATVAGWGRTKYRGYRSKVPLETNVEIHSKKDCVKSIPKRVQNFKVTDRMVCAGVENGKQDSCQGDSGGPLIFSSGDGVSEGQNYEQTGVVSVGFECGKKGRYGIYEKVSYVRDWIQETTARDGTWCPRTRPGTGRPY